MTVSGRSIGEKACLLANKLSEYNSEKTAQMFRIRAVLCAYSAESDHCGSDCVQELVVGFEGGDGWVVGFDLVGALEEEACLACLYHAQVVVAVAGCDCLVAD